MSSRLSDRRSWILCSGRTAHATGLAKSIVFARNPMLDSRSGVDGRFAALPRIYLRHPFVMKVTICDDVRDMSSLDGRFRLPGADGVVEFEGRLLAQGSTHEPYGERSRRWSELAVFRRSDGGYVTHVVGRSTLEGETDRNTIRLVDTPADVYNILVRRGRVRHVEADVLEAAAQNDPVFAQWLGDRLDVEDLETVPDGGRVFVLARDDDRALRFRGVHIAHASSRDEENPDPAQSRWTEIDVYAIAGPRYVVHKVQREAGASEPRRAVAWIVPTGKAALKALRRPGTTWLEAAAFDALAAAADASEHFEETLEGLLDDQRYKEITGSTPSIGPPERDARRLYLEVLAAGARLVTEQIDARNSRAIGWVGADAPLPPWRILYRLSRERLIRHARGVAPATSGTIEWELSDLGRQAIARSKT